MLRHTVESRIFICLHFTLICVTLLNISEIHAQEEPVFSYRPAGYLYQSNQTQEKSGHSPLELELLGQGTVVFDTNISHPHQFGVFVECDLVLFGEFTKLLNHANTTFELKELNPSQNDSARNPWMSCRFSILIKHELRNDYFFEYTPPRKPYKSFDPYYNVSLSGTRGSGNVTRVFLNDTGIYVEQQFLSQWGAANKSHISSDPGFKLLNSNDGASCKGACAVMKNDNEPVCVVHGDFHFSKCTPRSDYDIKKYAYDEVLTATGIPCVSKCEVTAGGYMCKVRIYQMILPLYSQVCSPSPGLTNMGEKCTGPCTFYNNYYMTCPTGNKTSHQMPCSASTFKQDL